MGHNYERGGSAAGTAASRQQTLGVTAWRLDLLLGFDPEHPPKHHLLSSNHCGDVF